MGHCRSLKWVAGHSAVSKQPVHLLYQGQDEASAFLIEHKTLNSIDFGLFCEAAICQWFCLTPSWELQCSSTLFSGFFWPSGQFFTAELFDPWCGALMVTTTGVFHCWKGFGFSGLCCTIVRTCHSSRSLMGHGVRTSKVRGFSGDFGVSRTPSGQVRAV